MSDEMCLSCGREMGLLTGKVRVSNGFVCSKCWAEAGFSSDSAALMTATQYASDVIQLLRNSNLDGVKNFTATRKISCVEFDDESKKFVIRRKAGSIAIRYDQIADFELLEDGESISSGGIGRALAGAAVLGGVGAIVGSATGSKKTKSMCSSLKIKVTVKNYPIPAVYIPFIESQTKKSGTMYQTAYQSAQDILSAFQLIADNIKNESAQVAAQQASVSTADEIRKFKQLCDEGIITEEEFDKKKHELLGF